MIKKDILLEAGIDYEAGLTRFMNDEELYCTVLTAFIEEDACERATAAYKVKNMRGLLEAAHDAKGICGNVGLNGAYEKASALVLLLRGNIYTDDELTQSFSDFARAYGDAQNAIKAALS